MLWQGHATLYGSVFLGGELPTSSYRAIQKNKQYVAGTLALCFCTASFLSAAVLKSRRLTCCRSRYRLEGAAREREQRSTLCKQR